MLDFSTLLVSGLPLIVVIFGLVEFSKVMGLKGRILTLTSLLLGLVFGIAYQIAQSGLPVTFAAWFAVSVFGLALGLVTSGLYKFVDNRFPQVPNFRG
jgi:hypothetical protein